MHEAQRRGLRPFKPGVSGNPAGRPLGNRNRFSEAFCHDLAEKWAADGGDIINRAAALDPVRFFAVAASLIPKEVAVSLATRTPGNLDPEEWQIAVEVFSAIKASLPDASDRPPGKVLQFVSEAIRAHDAKLIGDSPLNAPLDDSGKAVESSFRIGG